mgnify:CR=1 FL=1
MGAAQGAIDFLGIGALKLFAMDLASWDLAERMVYMAAYAPLGVAPGKAYDPSQVAQLDARAAGVGQGQHLAGAGGTPAALLE